MPTVRLGSQLDVPGEDKRGWTHSRQSNGLEHVPEPKETRYGCIRLPAPPSEPCSGTNVRAWHRRYG